MPSMPTRPLLFGTFLTSQSMVSYASVASSIAFGSLSFVRGGRIITNSPSRLVSAADVLEDEDVAVVEQLGVDAFDRRERAVDAVRRAHHQDRQRPARLRVGVKIRVWSFTPSRIGIMTMRESKPNRHEALGTVRPATTPR